MLCLKNVLPNNCEMILEFFIKMFGLKISTVSFLLIIKSSFSSDNYYHNNSYNIISFTICKMYVYTMFFLIIHQLRNIVALLLQNVYPHLSDWPSKYQANICVAFYSTFISLIL